MARVLVPPQLRKLTGGVREVVVVGRNLREIIDALDERFPGVRDRLLEEDAIRPGMAAAIDSVIANRGLRQEVGEESEVTFVPAIAGG